MCHESRCNTAHTSIIFSLSETQKLFLLFFSCLFFFSFMFLDFIFLMLSASFPFSTNFIMMTGVLLCLSVILFHHNPKFSLIETGWSASEKSYCTQCCDPSFSSSIASFILFFVFSWGNLYTWVFFFCRKGFEQKVKIVRNIHFNC